MNKEDISSGLAISEKMKEAYCDLNTDTPFSIWAQAVLWNKLEEAKQTRETIQRIKEIEKR